MKATLFDLILIRLRLEKISSLEIQYLAQVRVKVQLEELLKEHFGICSFAISFLKMLVIPRLKILLKNNETLREFTFLI